MIVPLVALVCGALLSVSLGVYGAKHEPTSQAITTLGFGSLIEMKVWLAVVAGVLALVQLIGALWMYGRFRVAAPPWVGWRQRTGLAAIWQFWSAFRSRTTAFGRSVFSPQTPGSWLTLWLAAPSTAPSLSRWPVCARGQRHGGSCPWPAVHPLPCLSRWC